MVATMVDHIVPLRRGGRDDETNYQSLCVSCHNVKTSIDGSRGDKCFSQRAVTVLSRIKQKKIPM
ncbi:MAG: HNH endonuclease [Anaerolineales bacterium]|nr:HNH endonuclease [Anaerolineales bacterium]